MDAIERRVAWIAISLAIVLGFTVTGGYGLADTSTWELTFHIVALVAVGGAAALLVRRSGPGIGATFSA